MRSVVSDLGRGTSDVSSCLSPFLFFFLKVLFRNLVLFFVS